jgi:hypothetical protein
VSKGIVVSSAVPAAVNERSSETPTGIGAGEGAEVMAPKVRKMLGKDRKREIRGLQSKKFPISGPRASGVFCFEASNPRSCARNQQECILWIASEHKYDTSFLRYAPVLKVLVCRGYNVQYN